MSAVFRCLCAALFVVSAAACANPMGPHVPPPAFNPPAPKASCNGGDHELTENEIGWAFCYPAGWKFLERVQGSDAPAGVDATFDVTDTSLPTLPYGFMIIGTYDRGTSSTLHDWLIANVDPKVSAEPIRWGNSVEAVYVPADATRYALTAHHVVTLNMKSGAGNLDLEAEMRTRLSTWLFTD
jgi:hypothetical protein